MKTEFVIEKAASTDFDEIRAFYDLVIDETEDMDIYTRWKKEFHPYSDDIRDYINNGEMYRCMADGKLVGVIAIPFWQSEEYHLIDWDVIAADDEVTTVHIFAIDPYAHGKGYGTAAMKYAISLAKEHGMKAIRLDALTDNAPARRLYEGLGFQLKGEMRQDTENAGWLDFCFYEMVL